MSAATDKSTDNQRRSCHGSRPCAGRFYTWAAAFALLGGIALAADLPIARFCRQFDWPGDLVRLLGFSEAFGHGLGVFFILLSVFVLDHNHRRAIPRVAAAAYGSGLTANLLKLLIARWRPHSFDFSHHSVWETFNGPMPFGAGGSPMQGFPSAHTATAVGLAVALAWLYPRGRWLFALFAVMVACQRMQSGAHFPSDTLFGAAVGCVVSGICLHNIRWFDRFETARPQR